MISVQSNLVLKEAVVSVRDMNISCPQVHREIRSLLRFLKAECVSKRLAWQVYSSAKKLAKQRGLVTA